ncbi:MAG: TonB-dependent receptor [Methylococcaceae bacterium]|nr:MAG: TonB-dependent receptor [Methylococcaceae bacterium]
MLNSRTLWHIFFVLLPWSGSTLAARELSEDEQALLQIYGAKEMISIATGTKQPIGKAPSVASVITAEDIKAMGATDIDEALETVPGLHVARSKDAYNSIYAFRGVSSEYNPQVLMLINGIPITDAYGGSRHNIWGGMPVQAIARIEVVRGPGSAVYGADAFAGVINIITKTRQDIKGTEVGGRIGSFDTYDGWALHGDTWAGFDVAAMVEYHDTQGQESIIEADAQTNFDQLFGTHASSAPGPVNLSRRNIDARVDFSREHWRLRGGLQSRSNLGVSPTSAQTLDPNGRYGSDRWNADLNYDNPHFAKDWDVKAQLSYLDTTQEPEVYPAFFPPGTTLPIDPTTGQIGSGPLVTFPQGFIGAPEIYERYARFNTSAVYTGFERHTLRVGSGFNYSSLYKVSTHKNSGINPITGTANPLLPNFSVIEVADGPYIFIHPADRKNFFTFFQDEWRFVKDWSLTAGLRYDNYSDFGNTINPRTALVWETRYDLTTKLMYGSAFRAPSFQELYSINNPVNRGNPSLKPETMDTVELAFDYRPMDKLRLGLNIFNYWWKDIIRFVPDTGAPTVTAQNTGLQTGYGTELEAEWQAADTLKLLGNYAFQKSQDEALNHDAGYTPHHQIYLRADWEFLPDWKLTPQVKWVIDRGRSETDNRSPVADYAWVDLTLRRQRLAEHWEVAFSVRNLFDVDAREPSLAGKTQASIPYDLPLAGRSVFGEIRFNF